MHYCIPKVHLGQKKLKKKISNFFTFHRGDFEEDFFEKYQHNFECALSVRPKIKTTSPFLHFKISYTSKCKIRNVRVQQQDQSTITQPKVVVNTNFRI